MSIQLQSKLEGFLFYKGEEVTMQTLSDIFALPIDEINQGIADLEKSLEGRGLVLVRKDNSVVLGIHGELGSLIESIRKDEITKDLSKAALETLSIVLYRNGVARSEIDYVRGVNSSFILRNLLVRGLVERIVDSKDSRRILYRPTFQLLSYMGVTSISQLPNYENVQKELDTALTQNTSHE